VATNKIPSDGIPKGGQQRKHTSLWIPRGSRSLWPVLGVNGVLESRMWPVNIIRKIARTLLPMPVRNILRPYWKGFAPYREVAGKKALEIGGPSEIFGDGGPLPIYSLLKSADNCVFSETTYWTGHVRDGRTFRYHPKKNAGLQFVCEATDLRPFADSNYQVVLASHCLEHIANPLRALEEWRRVLGEKGLLLLVLPHKEGTFDWKRPITTLEHMIEDYKNKTGEDDLTHLPEELALRDLDRQPAESFEAFERALRANKPNRFMHHHVFDTRAAIALVDFSGWQLRRVEVFRPFHIVVLASKSSTHIDNSEFLQADAEFLRRSPFAVDHHFA
jgi:hypothetical protein